MKVLIFGPSGLGKTHVYKAWKHKGIRAYEDSDINGLSGWYDKWGKKVYVPTSAREALAGGYSFLWSKQVLQRFLATHSDVYLLGGSGNLFDVIKMFEKVFFLKVEPEVQKERILHLQRDTPLMDFDEKGVVLWGGWLEEEAARRGIPFLDSTLSPDQLFEIIHHG